MLEQDTLYGGLEVFLAKEKKHGSTLSTAYAVFRYFESSVWGLWIATNCLFRIAERACRALKGEKGLRECAFVYLPGIDGGKEVAEAAGVNFFSTPIELAVRTANVDLLSSRGYKKTLT